MFSSHSIGWSLKTVFYRWQAFEHLDRDGDMTVDDSRLALVLLLPDH
jgi:hypothetical protein